MNESLFNDSSLTNLHVMSIVDHIHLRLPLNSDKFNLCSGAICRFSFTLHSFIHRPNAVQLYTVCENVHLVNFDGKLL